MAKRLDAARRLIEGLGTEKERWGTEAHNLKLKQK